jgi:hypothetical protein
VIEPTAPVPRRSRIRRVLAPLAVLGLLSGGLALARPGGGGTAEPLPLLADATARQGEASTMTMAPASDAANGMYAPSMPAPWGGLDIRVEGDLPDVGTKALAWDVLTPDLDSAGATRMARALGLGGEPVHSERGWVLETAEGNFSIWPSEPGWSVNFYRSAGASAGARPEDGEQRARRLLEGMGVLDGEWRVESQETDIGVGVACAEPARLKMAPADGGVPPPDRPVSSASCPPPPPPVRGVSVTFSPVLDGRRADWGAWGVTFGPGDSVQSLWGNWGRFQRRGDYELRPVSAALDEMRSGGAWGVHPMMATEGRSVAPAVAAPDIAIDTLACPAPMDPAASEAAKEKEATFPVTADCRPPKPRVVIITDVELGLLPAPGWDGQRNRLYLVPAYRFLGHFEDGSRYEVPVIALAPDAIAPPLPMPKSMPAMPKTIPMPMPAPTPID